MNNIFGELNSAAKVDVFFRILQPDLAFLHKK